MSEITFPQKQTGFDSPVNSEHLLAIQYRELKDLKPYKHNARTHSKKQLGQIAASIQEFGFTNPILIDVKDRIIAGHGRVEAAKLMGLSILPTKRQSSTHD